MKYADVSGILLYAIEINELDIKAYVVLNMEKYCSRIKIPGLGGKQTNT